MYAWAVVALLWGVGLLNYFDRLLITTMRDPIRADIAMDDVQFGLLTSVFLWIYAAVSPFGGLLADRVSRSWVIAASLLFWSGAMYVTSFAHTFHQLLWSRALMGLSEACYLPAALAIICDYHPGRTRSLATGVHMSGLSAGAALGGLGGYIAESFGWRAGFRGLGVVGLCYGLLIVLSLRDAARSPVQAPIATGRGRADDVARALTKLLGQRAFVLLMCVNILIGMVNWAMYGWLPTYLKEHFHLGMGAAGISATTFLQAAAFAGVFVGGWWADRWSRTLRDARRLAPALVFLAAGPATFAAASTPLLPIAIAGLICYGLSRGVFDANHMPILRESTDERFSATGFGLLNLLSNASGGAMVYVGGLLSAHHVDLSRIFQVSGVALSAAAMLLIFLKPTTRDSANATSLAG